MTQLLESIRFVERLGVVYRLLIQEPEGCWLISWEHPSAPFYISDLNLSEFEKTLPPKDFKEDVRVDLSQSQKKKLELIEPLLRDSRCIKDKNFRNELAARIASEQHTTSRRVLRLYYRYLATGRLSSPRTTAPLRIDPTFERAIRQYYFSSRRFSLRSTYEMMLLQNFTSEHGQLTDGAPTWYSFRHYFYTHGYHKDPQKQIAREGLTQYQRNFRHKFGAASSWRSEPGTYQMDATQADLYLVSRLDRNTVVGRPYIYLAVDTATQLIAGVYVGFACDETAVMACLAQAAGNKVEFCRKYGLEIEPEQWPNSGMPNEVVTDKGREFFGTRMGELCRDYGMEVQSLAPFRPDQKGLVEKAFDLLQSRYKPLLRGRGVIEEDAQERWSVDYRTQAVLDLEEFTKVVLHAVLYLNSGRLLSSGKTPAQLWLEHEPRLLQVSELELRVQTLPRENVKLTRKGFRLNRLQYYPVVSDDLHIGESYTLAYDPEDLSQVYLIRHNSISPCPLSAPGMAYRGSSMEEVKLLREQERRDRQEGRNRELEASTQTMAAIQDVIQRAGQNSNVKAGQNDGPSSHMKTRFSRGGENFDL